MTLSSATYPHLEYLCDCYFNQDCDLPEYEIDDFLRHEPVDDVVLPTYQEVCDLIGQQLSEADLSRFVGDELRMDWIPRSYLAWLADLKTRIGRHLGLELPVEPPPVKPKEPPFKPAGAPPNLQSQRPPQPKGWVGWFLFTMVLLGTGVVLSLSFKHTISPSPPPKVTLVPTSPPGPGLDATEPRTNSGQSIRNQMLEAHQLYETRLYRQAIAECDRILAANPDNREASDLRQQIIETMKILGIETTEPPEARREDPSAGSSFDCAAATLPMETLLCADGDLASAELAMVAAYKRVLASLAGQSKSIFQVEQRKWAEEWSRTCNAPDVRSDQQALKTCVATLLSERTNALRAQLP